jgi:hypothetical protein
MNDIQTEYKKTTMTKAQKGAQEDYAAASSTQPPQLSPPLIFGK